MSQDVGTPSTPSKSKIPTVPTVSPSSSSKSILGPYSPSILGAYSPSILGPYVPSSNPSSLPSILGPYIHSSTISMSFPSSPHAPTKDQQRHTFLNSLPYFPSICSPSHLPSCTHTMANGSKLDAKEKENNTKNPQNHKNQHVPSKQHVQEKKILIQNTIKKPQRLKMKNAKVM